MYYQNFQFEQKNLKKQNITANLKKIIFCSFEASPTTAPGKASGGMLQFSFLQRVT
jgi:hypothetical protein